jgi:hypothetical protein
VIAWLGILSGAVGIFGFLVIALVSPSLRVVVGLASTIGALVAALGLRARREWGRQGSIVLLCYSAAMGVYGAVRMPPATPAALTNYQGAHAAITAAQLHAVNSVAHTAAIVPAIFMAVIIALIALKLSSEGVRQEFNSASSA